MKFTHIYVFHNYSRLQSWITPNLYGVSPTMWRSSQSTQKGLHFGASSVPIAQSDQKIWAPKLELTFKFPNLVNFQSSVAPKPMGVSPPQMHITGISCPSTLIRRKSELHSSLRCGATTAQSTILQVMFITLRV